MQVWRLNLLASVTRGVAGSTCEDRHRPVRSRAASLQSISNTNHLAQGAGVATDDAPRQTLTKYRYPIIKGDGPLVCVQIPQVLALQAINLPPCPYGPALTRLAVTMHTRIPPLKFLLIIFSLLCSLSQGLTDAQINIVKQRLQEGSTHRLAPVSMISYLVSLFRREDTLAIHPWPKSSECKRWL